MEIEEGKKKEDEGKGRRTEDGGGGRGDQEGGREKHDTGCNYDNYAPGLDVNSPRSLPLLHQSLYPPPPTSSVCMFTGRRGR